MPLSRKQKILVKKFAYDYHKKLDQTHGVEHLERTLKLANILCNKEKADYEVVWLAAMLHQFHNGSIVRRFLKKIKVDGKLISEVVYCVDTNHLTKIRKAKTIEAKVVFDADKLQVVGPFGIIREISCDMVPPRAKKFREALEHTRNIEQRCFEALQTKAAKRLAKQPHSYVVNFWRLLDKWDEVKL